MNWTLPDIPDQTGRVAVVTGAGTGIGYETARALAHRGARIVLGCRDETRAAAAVGRILAEVPAASVSYEPIDLADLASVRRFSERIGNLKLTPDLLVNNAGVMAPPESRTLDGFELQIGVNHLGHFALTGLLMDSIRNLPEARVVAVSSIAHRMGRIELGSFRGRAPYRAFREYRQSKLANLMFTLELHRRLEASDYRFRSVAAHPGIARTGLMRYRKLFEAGAGLIGMPAWQGALPILYAATAPDLSGGEYYGPDGFYEIRGSPAPARIAARARDERMARQLWDASEELTGVRFPI
jgi:NAD(P)-dependent dehydrogenase (short-subunit alcohol dehydrogenase family)